MDQPDNTINVFLEPNLIPAEESINQSPRQVPRKVFIIPILIILSIGIGAWFGQTLKISKAPEKTVNQVYLQPTPTVTLLQSEVFYLTGTAWKLTGGQKTALKEGDLLTSSDIIETGSQSRLVISFDDGSIIRLDELTMVNLSSMTPTLIALDNRQGKVYARVQKDPQHKFTVQANNVVVEATGTIFAVENSDQIKVKVFESSVKVNIEGQNQTEVKEFEEWDSKIAQTKVMDENKNKQDKFLAWNMNEDDKMNPKPTTIIVPTKTDSGIELKAEADSDGVNLSWVFSGTDAPNGVKILKNQEANPTYPGSDFVYLGDTSQKSYQWDVRDGKIWHFRVCRYVDNNCSIYSNDISVQTVKSNNNNSTGQISSISLTMQKDGNKAILNWTIDGSSPLGFKISWSINENPTYPPRDGDLWNYQSDPGTRQYAVEGLSGLYHFRVCEYLGGSCGKYSNDVSENF